MFRAVRRRQRGRLTRETRGQGGKESGDATSNPKSQIENPKLELVASVVPLGHGQAAVVSADGHWLGTRGAEKEIDYVIKTAAGNSWWLAASAHAGYNGGMVLGPHYQHGACQLPSAELAVYVRETGEQLLADLRLAESRCGRWMDEQLGYAFVCCAMDRALARLAASGCWGKDNQVPSGELWSVVGEWLEVSWLQHRARFKPRGYAGDFEMFERFWRRECVDHPLGRLFDRYFQAQAAVEAVRARTEQIGAALVECCFQMPAGKTFHVVSVGCGPALDVRWALTNLPEARRRQFRITLVDIDGAALEHARHELLALVSPGQVRSVRENLYRLADKAGAADALVGADFLFCTGLFDYLPDDSAQKLLKLFWNQLAPGGRLLIGNFAPHNPTRAYMEWLGNWYLIYRTADELTALGAASGILPERLTVGAERLGIDLFLMAEK